MNTKDNQAIKIGISVGLLGLIILVLTMINSSLHAKSNNDKIDIVIEDESISDNEETLEDTVVIIDSIEEETIEETVDHTSEITSTQYTLGEGVRARLLPSEEGEIFKVIYDAYSPVGVIEEGSDWYKCCIDNTICYINWRYIGDVDDVEYVKDKKAKQAALEEKRKSSAYYTIFKNMTSEEYDLLARVLALEAGDQSFKGRIAVVETVLNRCISKNPYWPNTISEVLYQKGQFATIKYLSNPYCTPTDLDYDAINYVRDNGATVLRSILDEEGYDDISSLDYVYFATYHANGVSPVLHLGDHYFARESNKKYQRVRN